MQKRLRWLLVVTIMVVLVVGFYYIQNNKSDSPEDLKENLISDVDKIINKDLDESYPYTAREVVQYFVRIQKCYYNEEYTEEELVKLAYKATELFDDELNNENDFDDYFELLKAEIELYHTQGKVINSVIMDEYSEIVYSTVDGQKYASINCTYFLRSDDGTTKIPETYILRKDEAGRWKILGWKEYEENEWE
ncbi:MAG: hypothetical protein IJP13_06555 [Lachnospiraceae bacterium]|nr:hypothetical protein [Lachnospiraceae bacterium]